MLRCADQHPVALESSAAHPLHRPWQAGEARIHPLGGTPRRHPRVGADRANSQGTERRLSRHGRPPDLQGRVPRIPGPSRRRGCRGTGSRRLHGGPERWCWLPPGSAWSQPSASTWAWHSL